MTEPFEMGVFALSGEMRQLGPYRLLGQLATGGMGVIYLGRDPKSRRIAAVKTLLAPGGVSAEARKRFEREVKLARRVRSTHTARVLDSDVEAARPWMAMEYVPAPSLEALVVQKGPLEDERALRWIASGVVEALAELHGKGIVHRDVKPLNILLSAEGPKVIDFGISHASDLTSTKLTLGTIAFAAPEQAEGQASTPASDIYALGVTLAYVVLGKLPYPPTTEPLQQLNYVRRADISLDGLPSSLAGVIGDCLAMQPDDRPTAEQLVRRFTEGTGSDLPAGWSAMIDHYAAEGRRLRRAVDQSEAETVTRGWTSGEPGHTRHLTEGNEQAHQQPRPKSTPKRDRPRKPKSGAQSSQPRSGGQSKPRSGGQSKPRNTAPSSPRPQTTTASAGGPTPSGKPASSVNWGAVLTFLLIAVLGIAWIAQRADDKSHDASSGSSSGDPTHSSGTTDTDDDSYAGSAGGGSGGSHDGEGYSDGTDADTEPTPLSAEDKRFVAVDIDDCLDNYTDDDHDWTPATPHVTSCSSTDAYFRVVSVEDGSGGCSDDDRTWYHGNDDGTALSLCMRRNYAAGQCMFAEANGDKLSMYFNKVTPCDAGIPEDYGYTVKLTAAYPDGAPDDACGDDRRWTTDDGAVLCGDSIWKRRGLPSM